ncbi:MAG: enoyl-CoA hydratase/isomerase family protein [Solirubrobacterales bacterium]
MTGLLSIERRGPVALLTLQRPEKRNALSIDLRVELAEAFAGLASGDGVTCIVLTGAGSAFCSGMDVTEFGGDAEHKQRLVSSSTGAFEAVGSCRLPVFAAVNGPALAGGFALALLCDVRIAASSATFGFPELPRGIPPSYAAARAVLGPGPAAEIALSGRTFGAGEALRLGVVSEVVADREVLGRTLEAADRVAAAPRAATLETKRRILLDRERSLGDLFAEESRVFREALLGDPPDDAA